MEKRPEPESIGPTNDPDARDDEVITAELNRVVDEVGSSLDAWTEAAGHRVLASTDW